MEAFTICIYKTARLRVMRPMNKEKYEQKKKQHINPTEAYSLRECCTGWKKPYKCDLRAYIHISGIVATFMNRKEYTCTRLPWNKKKLTGM